MYQKNYNKILKNLEVITDYYFWQNEPVDFPTSSDRQFVFNKWNSNYHSRLNPTCLYKEDSIDKYDGLDFLLVRDGVIGLIEYFDRHKNPDFETPLLLVHVNFASFVPNAWDDHVVYFYYSAKNSTSSMVKKLDSERVLIYCELLENLADFELLRITINHYLYLGKKITLVPVYHDHNYFLNTEWRSDEFYSRAMTFAQTLEKEVQICDLNTFLNENECALVQFENIFSKELYFADDFNFHKLLNKGIIPQPSGIKDAKKMQFEFTHYPMNLNWGLNILGQRPPKIDFYTDYKIFQNYNRMEKGKMKLISEYRYIASFLKDTYGERSFDFI